MRKIKRNKIPLHGKIEPITIEERGAPQKITMEEIAKLHAEQHEEELTDGKPCICVSSSFRAVQLAFSNLWQGEIPEREDKFLTFSEDNLFIGEMDE